MRLTKTFLDWWDGEIILDKVEFHYHCYIMSTCNFFSCQFIWKVFMDSLWLHISCGIIDWQILTIRFEPGQSLRLKDRPWSIQIILGIPIYRFYSEWWSAYSIIRIFNRMNLTNFQHISRSLRILSRKIVEDKDEQIHLLRSESVLIK